MKKILSPENRRYLIKEDTNKLPKFIFDQVKNHRTSLGDNDAFPSEDEFSFDYKVLKNRFNEVTERVKEIEGIESLDEEYLVNTLGKLVKECRQEERPIRENLVKICENTVIEMFGIPQETVLFKCELVDRITPTHEVRLMPETNDDDSKKYDFEDVTELDTMNKSVMKRRLINSLIQGAAYEYGHNTKSYIYEIYSLNKKLLDLYDKITAINDYLLFIKKDDINEENTMQGAYVEVTLAHSGEKCEINAQGLTFPYLLGETIRGFFELFASHGLPKDNKQAMYIIRQADFLLAEPWDLRMGVTLWKMISKDIHDTKLLPYFFTELCEMETTDFNNTLKEIFSNTKKGRTIVKDMVDNISTSLDYQDFTDTIQQKNNDDVVLSDGYFSADELNDLVIEEDDVEQQTQQQQGNRITIDVLKNVNAQDIDFEVGEAEDGINIGGSVHQYQMYPVINGVELPTNIINFKAEERVVNKQPLYQVHLFLNDKIKHIGLGFKLIQSFIMRYGNAYFGFGRMLNKQEIPAIINKLGKIGGIKVKPVYNKMGAHIGMLATV